jgi:hypothetical protein
MNYYPNNFYSNYPYQNAYSTQPQLMSGNSQMVPQPAPAAQGIPGKIVDSAEVAKVADIPFGGYGVFPRADLSEIYVKMWNANGTTSTLVFQPIIESAVIKEESMVSPERDSAIIDKIKQLEEKIEILIASNGEQTKKRKELSASAY